MGRLSLPGTSCAAASARGGDCLPSASSSGASHIIYDDAECRAHSASRDSITHRPTCGCTSVQGARLCQGVEHQAPSASVPRAGPVSPACPEQLLSSERSRDPARAAAACSVVCCHAGGRLARPALPAARPRRTPLVLRPGPSPGTCRVPISGQHGSQAGCIVKRRLHRGRLWRFAAGLQVQRSPLCSCGVSWHAGLLAPETSLAVRWQFEPRKFYSVAGSSTSAAASALTTRRRRT